MTDFIHRFEASTTEAADRTVTFLALHGTGGNENDLVSIVRLIAPGGAVLSPRGQVSEHGANRFFKRFAHNVFDVDDLKARTDDLLAFVDLACDRYRRDRSRVIAVGFSNGANIAASLLMRHPGSLAGAILLRPTVPYELDEAPPPPAVRPRVVVIAGSLDPLIDDGVPARLVELLQMAGCEARLAWSPIGHTIAPRDITIGKELVASVLDALPRAPAASAMWPAPRSSTGRSPGSSSS